MINLALSSKGKTLEDLSLVITTANILPLYRFLAFEFTNNREKILNSIQQNFTKNIIIRSSSINEDNLTTSNAGNFDSVLDVDIDDIIAIEKAILKVVNSFGDNLNNEDEIFVQAMLENVTMSGVVFSSDIDTLSSYYIINYDESGSTNSVTSGTSNNQTFICFKENDHIYNVKLKMVIDATRECEYLFDNNFLDIEFAFSNSSLYILQVRAIVTQGKDDLSHIDLSNCLYKLNKKIKKLNAPHPNLLGNKTLFGVMPDWNPAEIIGKKPRTLALTIYKELITDSIWAYQRDNYGYRNLRSHPLLVSFLGVAYIDVRVSFNSFIPKTLDEQIATKLVNYYLEELKKEPHNHDKVEFEVIFSCIDFNTSSKLRNLLSQGFNEDEISQIKDSLKDLTNNVFSLYKKDLEKITKLEDKYSTIMESNLGTVDKIYWLNEYCKRYGTLPFAGLARAGFVAVSFLKSFVSQKIITMIEYNKFLNSVQTITKDLSRDLSALNKKDFLKKYGHLRPGTYDILSNRYDEAYDFYFSSYQNDFEQSIFEFNSFQLSQIDDSLKKNELNISSLELIEFIKQSIEAREYAKFIFTKSLSQILVFIEELGKKFHIDKEDLSYLDYKEILKLYSSLNYEDVSNIFNFNIDQNKKFFEVTKALKLPDLITNEDDIYHFLLSKNSPNFVTLNSIESNVVKEEDIFKASLENAIVCIKSADPGYDFLFTKKIGALVTSYGGANSHMAIRCSELNIPAVIGIGEDEYKKVSNSNIVKIDAKSHILRIIL